MQNGSYSRRFGLSQSAAKDWEKMSPAKWKRIWVEGAERTVREDHFDFGSLTDCLLFTKDRLKDHFVVADTNMKLPSEQIKKILDHVYRLHINVEKFKERSGMIVFGEPELKDYGNEIFEISRQADINYGKGSFPKERVIKEVTEKGLGYFEKLCEVSGKTIISFDDNMSALGLVDILRTHPVSRPYFVEQEGERLLFQHEIFIPIKEYGILPFFRENKMEDHTLYKKCALDIVRINHIKRTIQNADLKTSYDAYKHNFTRSIRKFKYGTQVSYYDVMLAEWRDRHYPGYNIVPPVNIAIDKFMKKPQLYRYRKEDMELLRFGGTDKQGNKIKGWEESLAEMIWHIENNIWDNSREMVEQQYIDVQLF